MDKNRLDTLEIEIVLNAIDIAKNELEKVYKPDWLDSKIKTIKRKLDNQQITIENENTF
ncbi:hypothetical protein [Paenibacillus sp. FSL H3-0333]|uniref:hypothetical protein n=1 Tax=Paenibacillus sp. FSL H3-0333 TaxID=2921373 RepID=UPI0030FC684C